MQPARYYGWLVSTLPARQLALVAARRLKHAAAGRARELSKPFERPLDLVREMNLPSPDAVAARLREGHAGVAAIDPRERQLARSMAQELFPEHANEVCERADRVLGGELFLFGAWRAHARGELEPGIAAIDWARDPISGRYTPDLKSSEIDRDAPGRDTRAVWEAGRLAHLVWLAQAHLLASMPGAEHARGSQQPGLYARALTLHVRDFLATQPVNLGIHWTCAMEASLRAMNLAIALSLVRDEPSFDAPFWTEAATFLIDHLRFVDEHLEDAQAVPGNHLLCDLAGLAVVSLLFPELPGAVEGRADALDAYAKELLTQSTVDGLSFESSLPYHRFVTELSMLVESVARRQGLTLGPAALSRLWLMCDVVQAATLTDGKLVALGDDDSSRALPFTLRDPRDGAHIAPLKAALGGGGSAAPVPEVLWVAGVSGLRRLERAVEAPVPASFAASGLAVLRDGQRSASLWAGANGQMGLGGHAHNDKLSCEVVLAGRRLTVDPGCPVYFADLTERDLYRSTGVHPTVRVDGLEQSEIPQGRPFVLPDTARASLIEQSLRTAVGEHRAYARLRPAVTHRREVSLPRGVEAVLVTDRLLGEGEHVCEVQWPMPTREVVMRASTAPERELLRALEHVDGEGRFDLSRVFSLPGLPDALLAVASEHPWEAVIEESTWSPGYGRRSPGRTVRLVFHAPLPLSVTCAFVVPAL